MFLFNLKKKIFFLRRNKNTGLVLRKNKTFLKSRFNRFRQWSKVIVYFAVWFNVFSITTSFLFFYGYVFNFKKVYFIFLFLILLSTLIYIRKVSLMGIKIYILYILNFFFKKRIFLKKEFFCSKIRKFYLMITNYIDL